jgi:arsenite oxidase small subunit
MTTRPPKPDLPVALETSTFSPARRAHCLQLASATLVGLTSGALPRRARADAAPVSMAAPTRPWQSVEFSYPAPGRDLPGIAVRLPDTAGGGLYAACLICPHQGCTFGYETDYEAVADIIGVDLDHPVMFCRCHFSTYDPVHDGNVIYGPAPRPPWRFTVAENAGEMTVTDVEPGAGQI